MNEILLNVVVLVFEVLYYALFMKFARKEGKFWRYLLLFSAITVFFYFVGTSQMYSYLFLILMILYGIKYIVKVKVSLFDMFMIIVMLVSKLFLEFILCMLIYLIIKNTFVALMIANVFKIILLFVTNYKLNNLYNKLKSLWDNNNFYIRYIFSCSMFIYVIFSVLFLIYR